jgi:nicotinamide-nucleotide amidase
MAAGALQRLGGDVAVAVSGIAGPDGGTADKPVGTVWISWAWKVSGLQDVQDRRAGRADSAPVRVIAARYQFEGDRDAIRRQAVVAALDGVLRL